MGYTPPRQQTEMEHRAVQYQPWETAFLPSEAPADPYREAYLRVEITDPYGDIRWRDGFWDGGVWRLRFMPLEDGPHHVRLETNLTGLPDTLGVVAAPSHPSAHGFHDELSISGPVRIAHDRTRFGRHDGQPFFMKCDSAGFGPILATDAEWAYYVAFRQAQGFNAARFAVGGSRSLRDRYGRPLLDPSTGTPNLSSLADLDRRIATLNANGLVAIASLPELAHEDDPERFREDETILIGRYLVARWGAFDVLWLSPGEAGRHSQETELWRRLGREIFGGDPWRAPVGMSLRGMESLHPSLENEPWLNWIAYQADDPDESTTLRWIRNGLATEAARPRALRPIVNLSLSAEGPSRLSPVFHDVAEVRGISYTSLFAAPPAGIGYTANGVRLWEDGVIPDEARQIPELVGRPDLLLPMPTWIEALHYDGAEEIGAIDRKLSKRNWQDLVPAPELIDSPLSSKDIVANVGVLANADLSVVRVYVPKGTRFHFRFPTLQGAFAASWVNPRKGGQDLELAEATGGSIFVAPDDEDWILALDAEDAF